MYSHVVAHNYRVCICMQKEALNHKILFKHSLPIFDGLNHKNYTVSGICAHVDFEITTIHPFHIFQAMQVVCLGGSCNKNDDALFLCSIQYIQNKYFVNVMYH